MAELDVELWRRIARKHYHGIWNGEECDHHHHSKDTAARCARTRRRYVSEKIHMLSVSLAEVREDRDRLRGSLDKIRAWSHWHKQEARTQLRDTMKLIHDEARAALEGRDG